MSKNYTGREIAIFTDAHGLLEPTQAALEDIASRGITEIYSLGDNIGVGPNPSEVLDLLIQYNVQSIALILIVVRKQVNYGHYQN